MNFNKVDIKNKITRVSNNTDKKIIPFKDQIYEKLRDECLKSGKLFEDPLFQPVEKNIFYTQSIPYGTVWKRPKEITSKPMFIVSGVNANDLDQGYLGNCWFIAGCAAIVIIPELFDNVVPSGQSFEAQYAGIFRFHFWLYGQWTEVVVDDRLPVNSSTNKLLFCSNKQEPNEFWAALLEKAYAKVCGNYENLDGGSTTDALIDMTGGIQETFEIKDKQTEAQKLEMWKVMVKSRQHKSLIGASIAPNPRIKEARLGNGLVMGHAYTVTRVASIEIGTKEIKLIRVRNPWGNDIEWRGAWSDNSLEWNSLSNDVKEALNFKKLPDGEFWMNFDDFYRNFETVQFCDITPDALSEELLKKQHPSKAPKLTWKLTAYHDEWVPGKTSGGCGKGNEALYWTNPQFLIKLTDVDPLDNENMSTLIVSLLQKNTRQRRTQNKGQPCEEFIQFRLYKIKNSADADSAKKTGKRLYASQLERVGVSGPYINLREVTHRFRTTPGDYLIIPSCYDAGITGQFLLRLYTESPINDSNCTILHDHKDDLKEEDVFFKNPKDIDAAFSSWTNLLGNNAKNNDENKLLGDMSKAASVKFSRSVNATKVFEFSLYKAMNDDEMLERVDFKKLIDNGPVNLIFNRNKRLF